MKRLNVATRVLIDTAECLSLLCLLSFAFLAIDDAIQFIAYTLVGYGAMTALYGAFVALYHSTLVTGQLNYDMTLKMNAKANKEQS